MQMGFDHIAALIQGTLFPHLSACLRTYVLTAPLLLVSIMQRRPACLARILIRTRL